MSASRQNELPHQPQPGDNLSAEPPERHVAEGYATEDSYHHLFEVVEEGFCIIDVQFDADGNAYDWLYVETNPTFEKYTGLSEATGRYAHELIPNLERHWIDAYARVVTSGEPMRYVNYVAELNRWFDVRCVRFGPPQSRLVAILFNNVTEYKQTEADLREAQQSLEVALESAGMGMWDIDLIAGTARTNRRHHEIFGYSEPLVEWSHATFRQHILPEDQPAFDKAFTRAMNLMPFELVARVRWPDGSVHWIRDWGRVYCDADGVPVRMAGVTRDITEWKIAADAGRQRDARLHSLFASIDEGFCICELLVDEEGQPVDYRFVETNPLFEEMTGLVNAVGRTAYELVPNLEKHWVETYARAALGGETFRFENGSETMGRWFDVFVMPVEPHGWFALVFKDISERKRIEAERTALLEREQAARQEAERATALQRVFLGMVSHELRTPLASIKGFSSSLLATDVTFTPEESRDFIGVIDAEADKLTDLIEQLLNVVRLQAGTLRVNPTVIAITRIIEQTMPQLRMLTTQHELLIIVGATLPQVLVDSQRIEQVLVNLVGNAAKFSPSNTPITISARLHDAMVEISVSDEGEGIPESERIAVFEPFHQVVLDGKRQRGTGLGLAICKGLIEANGGSIWIQDRPGPGTTFSFTLPIAPAT